jgi:16S rRNA (cytosine1402-N4)-methyltransferase
MRDRIVELVAPSLSAPGAVYVDCTLGLAGHAMAVLAAAPGASLVGIDRDAEALAHARAALREAGFADRITLVEAVYDELPEVLDDLGIPAVAAILADLGLSSLQIDTPERGFAYAVDAPLDMRMSAGSGITAAEVVNTYPVAELARVLREYGEERFADRIARAIVDARQGEPFASSRRLVEVVAGAIPAAARSTGGHPAKRTFQALRIEVNGELDALAGFLPAALDALAPGGRIAVLSYHSLEDRLVKRAFRDASTDSAPRHLPVVPPEYRARFRLLTRGAERPDEAECAANPRAASARLRAAERLEVAP